MKKIAFATVAMLSTLTFFASSKQSAEPRHTAVLVAEKANFKPQNLTIGIETTNKANLAQADYGDN